MSIPRLKLVTAATDYPISVDEMKAYANIYHTEDTDMVSMLIGAATEEAEKLSGLALMSSTWRMRLDWFPTWELWLPGPVISISSITYYDGDNASQTFASTKYEVDTDDIPSRLSPKIDYSWPATYTRMDAVTVNFIRGYASATDVPAAIRLQIMALAQWWYNEPTRRSEVPEWFVRAMAAHHHGELNLFDLEA